MKFLVLIVQNNRSCLVYIGFPIYRITFAVRNDPIYLSSSVQEKFTNYTFKMTRMNKNQDRIFSKNDVIL